MARTTPVVDGTLLHEPGGEADAIVVGSPAWYTWLAGATTFAYTSASGRFTARCERSGRRGWYWKAYRKHGGVLHRAYLGRSADLTPARLAAIAARLAVDQPRSPAGGGSLADRGTATPAPTTQLLGTKRFRPTLRASLVPRPHLVSTIRAGLRGKLTMISAPAGFGKTTLISAVLVQAEMAAAWLTLDAADNDPARFLQYLLAALETVGVHVPAGAAAVSAPDGAGLDLMVVKLVNALAAVREQRVLVLDDYHLIDAPQIHQALALLLDHLPPSLHLVIVSRADPPLPLARLRSRGELCELRAADLRFTPAEAQAFLTEVMQLPLTAADVAALETRTEGWIAGLQFAALAMRDRTDLTGFVDAFTGSHRFVVDYLAEEVFERQPPHLQRFLLHTAILDRLCGTLCDALMLGSEPPDATSDADPRQAYSQVLLLELERANLFVMPLDDERRWYRYHHLFAEVLRARLVHGAGAGAVATLHCRASAWYEAHGSVADAVQHALAGTDWDRAARLIDQHALALGAAGQLRTVRGWLDTLPDAYVRARPALCITHAFFLMALDQLPAAQARLDAAEHWIAVHPSAAEAHTIRQAIAQQRGTIARYLGELDRCVAFGQQALALDPDDTGAQLQTAHAFLLSGDVSSASERLVARTAHELGSGGHPFVSAAVRSIALLGRLHAVQGRLPTAAERYAEAASFAGSLEQLKLLPSGVCYFFGLGELQREMNALDEAEQLLRVGMQLVRGSLTPDAEWTALGYLALARVLQARGEGRQACATLDEFVDLARRRGFAGYLRARTIAASASIGCTIGDLSAAVRWADEHEMHADNALSYTREVEHMSWVRVRIAQALATSPSFASGAIPEHALALLDRLLELAMAQARTDSVIRLLVLRALALDVRRERDAALATLARALVLAEPAGYVRVFVDEGAALWDLLRAARDRRIAPRYIGTLLAAEQSLGESSSAQEAVNIARSGTTPHGSIATYQHARSRDSGFVTQLVEPLSGREREVLRLLVEGSSNGDIARSLVIAVSTVKSHLHSIFAKLGVRTRTQAIARARDLGLR